MFPSTTESTQVVIGIDPHKASWTAAVGPRLQPLATIRVPVDPRGYRSLRRFATRWPRAVWAIEGAGGLGSPLATRLSADGITAQDVPAKLAARVRMLSTGHGRKNDTPTPSPSPWPRSALPDCARSRPTRRSPHD